MSDNAKIRPVNQTKDLALVILSVLFCALAFPYSVFPWLAWFVFIPMGITLPDRSCRDAFAITTAAGLFMCIAATWWIFPGVAAAAHTSILVTVPFAIIYWLIYAIPYGIAGMLCSRMGWFNSISGATKSAFLWTAVSTLVLQVIPGNIAHSQYLYPRIIQIADIGGIPLLFFAIIWVNWLLVAALLNLKSNAGYAAKACALALAVVLLIAGYGEWRLQTVQKISASSNTPHIEAGWVQPNLSIKGRDRAAWEKGFARMEYLSRQLLAKPNKLDLLIWPEIPPPVSYMEWKQDNYRINQLLKNTSTALLLTGYHTAKNGYYNVVEFIPPSRQVDVYQKQHLLPFAEYLPGETHYPFLRALFPGALRYLPGKQSRVFSLQKDVKLIPLICYEAAFPKLVKAGWKQGGNIIVNPVDDAWFGRTVGLRVHLALAVFRTVEFRIPLIRVSNAGISALVTATGEIDPHTITPVYEANTMAAKVLLPSIKSIYSLYGDWFVLLSVIIAGLSLRGFEKYV